MHKYRSTKVLTWKESEHVRADQNQKVHPYTSAIPWGILLRHFRLVLTGRRPGEKRGLEKDYMKNYPDAIQHRYRA